jgi:hypothetical protein
LRKQDKKGLWDVYVLEGSFRRCLTENKALISIENNVTTHRSNFRSHLQMALGIQFQPHCFA